MKELRVRGCEQVMSVMSQLEMQVSARVLMSVHRYMRLSVGAQQQ